MTDYTNQENFCEQQFRSAGPYWHLCTEENFPIIFESADHFKQGMSVLAYCTLISQGIKLLTFALMSNHLHIVLSGAHSAVENYFQTLKGRLAKINCSVSHRLDDWQKQIIPIDNLESLRNAIAYVNRNGYVASTTYTPFSYPWGTNNLFFNNEMKACGNAIPKCQTLFHEVDKEH